MEKLISRNKIIHSGLGIDPHKAFTADGDVAANLLKRKAARQPLEEEASLFRNKVPHLGKAVIEGSVVKTADAAPDLADMTVPQLKEFAEANSIELGDATKRQQIIDAIEAAQKDDEII